MVEFTDSVLPEFSWGLHMSPSGEICGTLATKSKLEWTNFLISGKIEWSIVLGNVLFDRFICSSTNTRNLVSCHNHVDTASRWSNIAPAIMTLLHTSDAILQLYTLEMLTDFPCWASQMFLFVLDLLQDRWLSYKWYLILQSLKKQDKY